MSLTPDFSISTLSDGDTTEGHDVYIRQYDNGRIAIDIQNSEEPTEYATVYLTSDVANLLKRGLRGESFYTDCYPNEEES